MTSPDVSISVDPNIKPVRSYENGLPVHRRHKTPILCQNKANTYAFVPEDIAREQIADGIIVEVTPDMEDYMKGVKLALGQHEGCKPGEGCQVGGVTLRAEELGKFDADVILKRAEDEVERYSKAKSNGTLKVASSEAFEGKARAQRFAKR